MDVSHPGEEPWEEITTLSGQVLVPKINTQTSFQRLAKKQTRRDRYAKCQPSIVDDQMLRFSETIACSLFQIVLQVVLQAFVFRSTMMKPYYLSGDVSTPSHANF